MQNSLSHESASGATDDRSDKEGQRPAAGTEKNDGKIRDGNVLLDRAKKQ